MKEGIIKVYFNLCNSSNIVIPEDCINIVSVNGGIRIDDKRVYRVSSNGYFINLMHNYDGVIEIIVDENKTSDEGIKSVISSLPDKHFYLLVGVYMPVISWIDKDGYYFMYLAEKVIKHD